MAVGDRERALGAMLTTLGYRSSRWPVPRVPGLPAGATSWVLELYRELGGIQASPVLAPRGWDHPCVNLVVELDEEQHFTRYRALTLQPAWARALPWADAYTTYSQSHEGVALARNASAGFWTKPGAEAQFGPSSAPRDLSGAGSARWKQRALYDAVRDAAAASGQVNLARLSVYDLVAGRTVDAVLRNPVFGDLEALDALIKQRTLAGRSAPTGTENPRTAASDISRAIPTPPVTAPPATRRVPIVTVPTLKELAGELHRTPKALRVALRERFRPHASQRGPAWDPLLPEMVEFLRKRFV